MVKREKTDESSLSDKSLVFSYCSGIMKFGEYLRSQKVQEWQHYYLDYDQLKNMIKELEEIHISAPVQSKTTCEASIVLLLMIVC